MKYWRHLWIVATNGSGRRTLVWSPFCPHPFCSQKPEEQAPPLAGHVWPAKPSGKKPTPHFAMSAAGRSRLSPQTRFEAHIMIDGHDRSTTAIKHSPRQSDSPAPKRRQRAPFGPPTISFPRRRTAGAWQLADQKQSQIRPPIGRKKTCNLPAGISKPRTGTRKSSAIRRQSPAP
jgi:hypothetical protein